ncbi:MAG TPA: hypothetical protein VK633_03770, partial [Verrucomicrobiae bacterium]|nr:hypothetical protein [Verrucomicrobiae bacterium]
VMALPAAEYEEQAKQFSAEIENSANPLVSLSFPAFHKCRQKELGILAELAMIEGAIRYKTAGPAALPKIKDPSGQGEFSFGRFEFQGVDRGFRLRSEYEWRGFPEVLIFVEKAGPPFLVNGKNAGQPISKSTN